MAKTNLSATGLAATADQLSDRLRALHAIRGQVVDLQLQVRALLSEVGPAIDAVDLSGLLGDHNQLPLFIRHNGERFLLRVDARGFLHLDHVPSPSELE